MAFAFYLLCGAWLPVTDPVEATYALSAKEMLLNGDCLVPTLFGDPWFDKPILFYLLTTVSFKLFGVSAFAARIIPALFAAASVTLLFWFTNRFVSRREGLLAALVLGSSLHFLVMSKLIVTDMVLFFFSNAALVFFFTGYHEQAASRRWYIISYACAALAVLTKGPVGLVLPGMIVLAFLVYQKNLSELKRLLHPAGLLVFMLIALPWYGEMVNRFGADFLSTFFGLHNYLRATVSEHPKDNVFYYYLVLFVLSTLPWSIITLRALYTSSLACWKRTADAWTVFSLLGVGIYLLFYSLMATKYPTYTFPALFPAAILTARQIAHGRTSLVNALRPAISLLAIVFFYLSFTYLQGSLKIAISLLLAIMLYYTWKRLNDQPVVTSFVYVMIAFLLVCGTSLTNLAESRSGVSLGRVAQPYDDMPIGLYRVYSTSAVFYSGARMIKLEDTAELINDGDVWRSKYHIPTTSVDDFFRKMPNTHPAIVFVKEQDRVTFEKIAAGKQYVYLRNDNVDPFVTKQSTKVDGKWMSSVSPKN